MRYQDNQPISEAEHETITIMLLKNRESAYRDMLRTEEMHQWKLMQQHAPHQHKNENAFLSPKSLARANAIPKIMISPPANGQSLLKDPSRLPFDPDQYPDHPAHNTPQFKGEPLREKNDPPSATTELFTNIVQTDDRIPVIAVTSASANTVTENLVIDPIDLKPLTPPSQNRPHSPTLFTPVIPSDSSGPKRAHAAWKEEENAASNRCCIVS